MSFSNYCISTNSTNYFCNLTCCTSLVEGDLPGGSVELRDKEDHHAFVEGGAVHVDGRTQREGEGAGFVGDFSAFFDGLNGEGEGRGGTGGGKSG